MFRSSRRHAPIDIVAADGEYVGTFPTGATEMLDAFGPNGMAAFIELDEFDVTVRPSRGERRVVGSCGGVALSG